MTRRQEIIDALKARIASISEANGNSYTPKAYEWLVTTLDYGDLPAVILRDTKDQIVSNGDGSSGHTLSVEIEIYTAKEDAEPERLRIMAAELIAALRVDPFADEPIGDWMAVESVEIEIEQAEAKIAVVRIGLSVKYQTNEWEL